MTMSVNHAALEHAKNLIHEGATKQDSHWGSAQASADQENAFIERRGWDSYANRHLAYDPGGREETKERYKFPLGDFQVLHRSALVAIKQRAGSEHDRAVERAADALLQQLPKTD